MDAEATIVKVTADGNTDDGPINIKINPGFDNFTFYALKSNDDNLTKNTKFVERLVYVLKKEKDRVSVDDKNGGKYSSS